jgi:integrase
LKLQEYEGRTPHQRFEASISNLSEGTQRLYRRNLNEFCNWVGVSPDTLCDQALKWENSDKIADRGNLSQAVSDYMKKRIEEEGVHPNTVRSYKKAINKLLKANHLRLVRIENERKVDYRGVDLIQPELIRELADITKTNYRLRALIMTLKDSGLRVSDIVLLTAEDYMSARRFRDDHFRVYVAWSEPFTTQKNSVNAYIRLGPESVEWIDKYLGNRKHGPLFTKKNGEPLKPHTVSTLITHLCKPLQDRGHNVSAHSFRKFFMSTFQVNGQLNAGKIIAGKRINPTDEPYLDLRSHLDNIYKEVYNSERAPLSIYESSQREKVQGLELVVEELRGLGAEQENEIAELREWSNYMVAFMLDNIKKNIADSPDPEKAEVDYLELVEKHEAEYYGKPFNEILNPDILTSEQRETFEKVKMMREFGEFTQKLDPNKKYSFYFKEVKDQ